MNSDYLKRLSIILIIIIGIPTFAIWADKEKCRISWENSSFQTDWGFFKGCVIKNSSGNWVPSSAYREINGR